MQTIVTGGAGFIGSHLCEKLLNNGHELYCIDNFITGHRKNIEHLLQNPKFHLVEHDISLPLIDQISTISQVDEIYHLASPASPVDYKDIPLQTLWTNAAGTKHYLELAVRNDARFLLASTSEIYGDPEQHPQKESYYGNVNPIGERSCYNEGKRFAESLAVNFWRHFKFPLAIVRIFNTYGPRMRKHDGRVIPEFIAKSLANEPISVAGDGKQTRSFCYIDDMVDGLMSAMENAKDWDFKSPINLGNPEEISIIELANKIKEMTASSSVIRHVEKGEDDPMRRRPDITLAKDLLGFEPKVRLEDGLRNTIEDYS